MALTSCLSSIRVCTRGGERHRLVTVLQRISSPTAIHPSVSLATPLADHVFAPLMLPVDGVVGVVTLGNLSSKILSNAASPRDPVKALMFTQFTQVPLATPLSAFPRIFEKDAFCLGTWRASNRTMTIRAVP